MPHLALHIPHLPPKHMPTDAGSAVCAAGPSQPTAEPVLITEREAQFSTAAAALGPSAMPRHHWLRTTLAAAVAHIHFALPPPRPRCPRYEMAYFEMARAARHMEHL